MTINCFSQIHKPITKGNIMLDGGGTIQTQKDKYTNAYGTSKASLFYISLSPGFGYFVIDQLAVGLNASLFYNSAGENKYYSLGIGPMARYYFNNGPFLKTDLSVSYLHSNQGTSNQKFFMIIPGAGYAFFLNPKVSLEPCLCYEFDNINYNSSNNHKISAFRLEVKLSIFL